MIDSRLRVFLDADCYIGMLVISMLNDVRTALPRCFEQGKRPWVLVSAKTIKNNACKTPDRKCVGLPTWTKLQCTLMVVPNGQSRAAYKKRMPLA